jgi:hypothetical protein
MVGRNFRLAWAPLDACLGWEVSTMIESLCLRRTGLL